MKSLFAIILIFKIVLSYCQDCQTPDECYKQALGLFNQDRSEMKRITEESQYRLMESNLVFDRKLNEIKAELTEKKILARIN